MAKHFTCVQMIFFALLYILFSIFMQTEDEENARRKKRQNKRSGMKRSLLLDDLANDDLTSFGYDKREVADDDEKRSIKRN